MPLRLIVFRGHRPAFALIGVRAYSLFFLLIIGFVNLINAFDAEWLAWVGIAFSLALAVVGWRALDRITPEIFLVLPAIGWLIYFIVKGVLSVIVGMFGAPYFLAKKVTNVLMPRIEESVKR